MEIPFSARTDMASEAQRSFLSATSQPGVLADVEARERCEDGFSLFEVIISGEEGARRLGKPIGRYVTMELDRFFSWGDERFSAAVLLLSRLIRELLGFSPRSALFVGLGNEDVTPDALGPQAARCVFPTRHLKLAQDPLFSNYAEVSVCIPGVLGTSGVESARQIAALCREIRPDCVLVADALAGSDAGRLCRTIQLADSGIAPGSGVGNNREQISPETLGLPVLAIGVPTVIDASAFDARDELKGLFVTPRDIDSSVRSAGRLIGYAVDLALHRSLCLEELRALLE